MADLDIVLSELSAEIENVKRLSKDIQTMLERPLRDDKQLKMADSMRDDSVQHIAKLTDMLVDIFYEAEEERKE